MKLKDFNEYNINNLKPKMKMPNGKVKYLTDKIEHLTDDEAIEKLHDLITWVWLSSMFNTKKAEDIVGLLDDVLIDMEKLRDQNEKNKNTKVSYKRKKEQKAKC